MSKTWFDRLFDQCAAAGQKPRVLHALQNDGQSAGRLLTINSGGRALACELDGVDHNLFFHTVLDSGPTGGDRLWLAPEIGWFWPSLADARRDAKGTASVPPQIDPGQYVCTSHDDRDGLSHATWCVGQAHTNSNVACDDVRSNASVSVDIDRTFRLLSPQDSAWPTDVTAMSFATTTTLAMTRSTPDAVIGAWHILQVPPTGTLCCPTTMRVDPRSYYDPFGDRHVQVDDDCVRFLIDGNRRIKMGIKPEHTTGRMGYYRPMPDERSSLIVRVFAPMPGEPYCDIPIDSPDDQRLGGDCLQAYNDDGDAFGGTDGENAAGNAAENVGGKVGGVTFGEMEYHDPCLVAGRGPDQRIGSCVTHVLVGPDDAVRDAGRVLLGVAINAI